MIVSFDGDVAGTKAASRAVSLGFEKGMQTKILRLPKEYDPDNFVKKYGVDAYNKLKDESIPGLKFLIQIQKKGMKSQVPEEKTQIVKNIANELGKIPDLIVRDDYIRQTSEYLQVDEGILRSIINKKADKITKEEKARFLPAEEILLLILFKHTDLAPYVLQRLNLEYMKSLRSVPIFQFALTKYNKNKNLPEISEIKDNCDQALVSLLSKVLIESGYQPSHDEAKDCLEKVKEGYLENKRKELNAQIKQLQRNKEEDKIKPLLKQITEISNQLSGMPE